MIPTGEIEDPLTCGVQQPLPLSVAWRQAWSVLPSGSGRYPTTPKVMGPAAKLKRRERKGYRGRIGSTARKVDDLRFQRGEIDDSAGGPSRKPTRALPGIHYQWRSLLELGLVEMAEHHQVKVC